MRPPNMAGMVPLNNPVPLVNDFEVRAAGNELLMRMLYRPIGEGPVPAVIVSVQAMQVETLVRMLEAFVAQLGRLSAGGDRGAEQILARLVGTFGRALPEDREPDPDPEGQN